MNLDNVRFSDGPRLLADVGGTNARFAIETSPRQFDAVAVLPCSAFPSLGAAAAAYLNSGAASAHAGAVRHAAIAIANPIDGDAIRMTNHTWSFSTAALRKELDLSTLLVVNDFTALAMALPYLRSSQRIRVGGGVELPGRTIGLVGPGTGLGVSGIVPVDGRWAPLASEGGHASFAPADDIEIAIMQQLWHDFGHASAERLLSGPGLELIYRVISGGALGAAAITERALAGQDADCLRTVDCFCGVLGSVAGNVALTLGATGGMYIGGGIVPRLGALFAQSPFRARFEAKGRLQSYLEKIPTYLITEQYPAFLGVSAILSEQPAHRH
ncbi:glucokinase [Massilia sp. TSP1-1-2]|uniref:glucokinase n=1 Tax=unclassified Massilia TaxID=2609279 RepID=UPI003CF23E1C